MKNVTKLMALVMALLMVLGVVPAMAEEAAAAPTAFLMYADGNWAYQVWNAGERPEGITVTEAVLTGEGDYTVGLSFATPAEGLAFAALGISDGEANFPGWKIKINEIRVNGEAIAVSKGYTSSDDGVVTRMNIFNEWVGELPADARSFDGNVDDANWMIVDREAFAAVNSVEVDFSFMKYGVDTAYIMFADSAWGVQYWLDGNAYDGVVATNATVTGAGDYTVGLDFTGTSNGMATGVAFTALGIKKGENLIAKETELAEANARLEQAETALTDVLAVVQTIRTELNAVAPVEEAPVEEAPAEEAAEEAAEAPAEEEVVTIEPVEETEAPAEEAPVEETSAEDATEAPAEETTEEVPVEE